MSISSPGIGSGLDVQGIVSKLVALEKRPLGQLQTAAAGLNARVSAYGQLKSQIANLQDQAAKLASGSTWGAMSVSSSNATAVSGVATDKAVATAFSVEVSQLARAQSTGSSLFTTGSAVGTGTLKVQLGGWGKDGDDKDAFTAGAGAEVSIDITAADDTLTKVAAKINGAKAGVTATVLRDGSGERLLMRSSETGVAQGFRIQATEDAGAPGLARLAFDPQDSAATGAMALTQGAKNTLATINGVPVASKNNTLTDAVEGLTLTVAQTTEVGKPVEIGIKSDTAGSRSAIKNFVESYNALSNAMGSMTSYDAKTKTAGTLQGDSTAVNLQSALRRLVGGMGALGVESSGFGRLSDVGVQFQADGTLKIDDTKLDAALKKPEALKNFFSANPEGTASDGMAVRIKEFAAGMLGADGMFATKTKSLEGSVKRNATDQQKVTDSAARTEARLLAQYARLDATMGKLDALNSYVSQQVSQWNRRPD